MSDTATATVFGNIRADNLRIGQITMFARMPSGLKLLVRAICDHHNDGMGFAWPSVDRLAQICSTTTRTIRRQLAKLKEMGLVTIVENVPGIKTQAYVVREEHIAALMIEQLKPKAKHTLADAADFVQQALNLDSAQQHDAAPIEPPPAPAPVVAVVPVPDPVPAPVEPVPVVAAPPAVPEVVDADKLQAVNTQRAANGKTALLHSDITRMRAEAVAANITLSQAFDWVLERDCRNFFRAAFVAEAKPVEIVIAPPAPPAEPVVPPTPEQIAEREAARKAHQEARAIEAANAKAKAKAFFDALKNKSVTTAPRNAVLDIDVCGVTYRGPDWAVIALQEFFVGETTSRFRMDTACAALGVSYDTVRKEREATSPTAAHCAPTAPAVPVTPVTPVTPAAAPVAPTATAPKAAYLMTESEYEAARDAAMANDDDDESPF